MKLHHIGIASKDLERSIRHHEAIFNLHPITEIVEDPVHKVSVVLLSDSDETGVPIELVYPLSEDSPASNLLKRGIHLYHICYTVDDIESALKKARTQGAIIISGPSPARLYGGRRIAFIYTPDRYVVEFLEQKA
jgi:methylmalonyl-CoA/ethylmalonyl-CoA epimerase